MRTRGVVGAPFFWANAMRKERNPPPLVGKIYGTLTVLCNDIRRREVWYARCRCSCGRTVVMKRARVIVNGRCGPCGRRWRSNPNAKYRTPEYKAWIEMRRRCRDPKRKNYCDYGGRGIKVCERWEESFENFFADMGPKPSPEHSLDRKNNDGNYEFGNCRWATDQEQMINQRRTCFIEFKGEKLSLSTWSKRTGLGRVTITKRLQAGWTVEDALTTPASFQNTSIRAKLKKVS
jgi:hypothetical protein